MAEGSRSGSNANSRTHDCRSVGASGRRPHLTSGFDRASTCDAVAFRINAQRKHHGTAIVCTAVAAPDPQALVAATLKLYVPGPTAPLSARAGVMMFPLNEPVTMSV
jgi:hypothetical protein